MESYVNSRNLLVELFGTEVNGPHDKRSILSVSMKESQNSSQIKRQEQTKRTK